MLVELLQQLCDALRAILADLVRLDEEVVAHVGGGHGVAVDNCEGAYACGKHGADIRSAAGDGAL